MTDRYDKADALYAEADTLKATYNKIIQAMTGAEAFVKVERAETVLAAEAFVKAMRFEAIKAADAENAAEVAADAYADAYTAANATAVDIARAECHAWSDAAAVVNSMPRYRGYPTSFKLAYDAQLEKIETYLNRLTRLAEDQAKKAIRRLKGPIEQRIPIMEKMLNEMTMPELQIALRVAIEDGYGDHIDSVRREITIMTVKMNDRHVRGRPRTAADAADAARAEATEAEAAARRVRLVSSAAARPHARVTAEAAARAAEAARAATLYAAVRAAEAEAEATRGADTRARRAAGYAHEATKAAAAATLAASMV